MKNHLEKKNAEYRIKQLISRHKEERGLLLEQNDELRESAAYLQRVVTQMIPLLPKQVVVHMLNEAKPTTNQGEKHMSVHKNTGKNSINNSPGPQKAPEPKSSREHLADMAQLQRNPKHLDSKKK